MGYGGLLKALEAYQPKRLVRGFFYEDGDCCAIGAAIPETRLEGRLNDNAARAMHEIGLSFLESDLVIDENDDFSGTAEERYRHMITWLRAKVAQASVTP